MALNPITQKDFDSRTQTGIVFVLFWAPWCVPCKRFIPVFEKVAADNKDVTFGTANTEAEVGLAEARGIQAIPTIMVFRDGLLLHQQAGALPAYAFQRLVEQIVAFDMKKFRAAQKAVS